jgi:hypothetical protein
MDIDLVPDFVKQALVWWKGLGELRYRPSTKRELISAAIVAQKFGKQVRRASREVGCVMQFP